MPVSLECFLNIEDPLFYESSGLKKLSILFGRNGFSFVIRDSISGKAIKLADYGSSTLGNHHNDIGVRSSKSFAYLNQIRETGIIDIDFKHVDIAIASQKITVAPAAYFENDGLSILMEVSQSISVGEETIRSKVSDDGPVIAALVPAFIREFINEAFPAASIQCGPAVFVKGILKTYSLAAERQVFIGLNDGLLEICVIQGINLIYMNSFRYAASSDILYYVIFVLEQLGFVPSEENLMLMGDIEENDPTFELLKMYCASLSFAVMPQDIIFGQLLEKVRYHKYFTLLNI